MKVIIDIPEKAYELLKRKPELDNIAESIIANGIPYEERPQGKWIRTPDGEWIRTSELFKDIISEVD